MNDKRIYLSPPHMSGNEIKYVQDVFDSNWIAPLGPHVTSFEKEFANYIGIKHAVAVSSGTASLHLALILSGIQHGDIVWCSTLTFVASANVIVYQGAEPAFIDSDFDSWNMDPELFRESIMVAKKENKIPKALILVHLYGQSADIDPIKYICKEHNIMLIEDAAEALGAIYKNKKVGTFGKFGVFSFNGNKIITTSSGGMLVSDNEYMIQKARFLSAQARDPVPHFEHTEIGYNYRMSNVLAAIGRGQLEVVEDRISRKRQIFEYYHNKLSKLPGLKFMPEAEYGRSNRWLTCLTIDPELFGKHQEYVRRALEKENIESRPVWKPMHLQPVFKGCKVYGGKVSEELFKNGLCLPSGSNLSRDDLDRIIEVIYETYHE